MKICAKVLRLNYNNVIINKIDMRSEAIDDMYRVNTCISILPLKLGINCAENPFNMGMFLQLEVSFKMGVFSDTQHTHIWAFLYWNHPPPPPPPGCHPHVSPG